MDDFNPADRHYICNQDGVCIVDISEIEPRFRAKGFNKKRLLRILRGFKYNSELPPIKVVKSERQDSRGYAYRLIDGMHRFYSSVAAGFTHIPVIISEQ